MPTRVPPSGAAPEGYVGVCASDPDRWTTVPAPRRRHCAARVRDGGHVHAKRDWRRGRKGCGQVSSFRSPGADGPSQCANCSRSPKSVVLESARFRCDLGAAPRRLVQQTSRLWLTDSGSGHTPKRMSSSAVIRRSCRAGNSRLLTGCRNHDQAIRPIRDRTIGLICTVTPVDGSSIQAPHPRDALNEVLDT